MPTSRKTSSRKSAASNPQPEEALSVAALDQDSSTSPANQVEDQDSSTPPADRVEDQVASTPAAGEGRPAVFSTLVARAPEQCGKCSESIKDLPIVEREPIHRHECIINQRQSLGFFRGFVDCDCGFRNRVRDFVR